MAQRGKSGRRTSTRQPVTIDLDTSDVSEDTVSTASGTPDAEPVAMENAGTIADASSLENQDTPSTAQDIASEREPVADEEATEPSEQSTQKDPDPNLAPPPAAKVGAQKGSMGSALSGGLIGGLIAILGLAGLQWGGVLPSFSPSNTSSSAQIESFDPSALQTDIDALRTQLSSLQQNSGSETTDAIGPELEAAKAQLVQMQEQINALQSSISSGAAGENAGLDSLNQRLAALETAQADVIAQVETQIAQQATQTPSAGSEAFQELTQAAEQNQTQLAAVTQSITELKTEQGSFQQELANTNRDLAALAARVVDAEETLSQSGAGNTVAKAIAAAGLKSAIDRGLPFMAELEAFASVGGEPETIEALRNFAASGVPTMTQLVSLFQPVANQIVVAGQGLDENASIADRLMSSAQSLIQVRPVGNVAGETPGAIAARMEVHLQEANVQAAINEWNALPDTAKAASQTFFDQMQARQQVDALVARVLNAAMAATAAPAQSNSQ